MRDASGPKSPKLARLSHKNMSTARNTITYEHPLCTTPHWMAMTPASLRPSFLNSVLLMPRPTNIPPQMDRRARLQLSSDSLSNFATPSIVYSSLLPSQKPPPLDCTGPDALTMSSSTSATLNEMASCLYSVLAIRFTPKRAASCIARIFSSSISPVSPMHLSPSSLRCPLDICAS